MSGLAAVVSLFRGRVVVRVSLGCLLLAVQRGLVSMARCALALLTLADTSDAFDLASLGGAFALIGESFALVRGLLPRVGKPISLVGDAVASLRRGLPPPHASLSRAYLCLMHLRLDLALLGLSR